MALHWAKSLNDREETLCGENVGRLLVESEDVTDERSLVLHDDDACETCRRKLG